MTMRTRHRLIEALDAIGNEPRPMNCQQAFEYLSLYVPGSGPRRDQALSRAFHRAARRLGARSASSLTRHRR
jgi:hypothetical protein